MPSGDAIPILDDRQCTIAGVSITNLHEMISEDKRGDVSKALERLTFTVS